MKHNLDSGWFLGRHLFPKLAFPDLVTTPSILFFPGKYLRVPIGRVDNQEHSF